MKTNNALQIIFAFFLGLVVVAFVAIGVNTFYPEPVWYDGAPESTWSQWRLATGIILLVCATLLLVVSLVLPELQAVLSNGVLLGGVFTMIYAVGMTVSSDRSVWRFVVAGAALAVTIGVGYLKFVRGRRRAAAEAVTATGAEGVAGEPASGEVGNLAERVAAVEHKLDALGRALRS